MNFTKKYITPSYLGIIDIGSYKIRIAACKFINKKVTILGYSEKRQNTSSFMNGECNDIPGLCEDINDTIKKLENENKVILEKVIINFPFGEIFAATKKINYKRSFPHTEIDYKELEKIIRRAQEISLQKLTQEIHEKNNIGKEEIELILSRINSFSIDKKQKNLVIGEQGENIKISLLNIFVPLSKYNLVHHIGNFVEKKIMRTLPSEFCTIELFEEKNLILLSIGATQTSISIKKDDTLIGISKIGIGMNHLISKISENTKEPLNKVLEKIDTENYLNEKVHFLSIWMDAILIGIKEIVGNEICPHKVTIFGGGGNNSFIQEALSILEFQDYDIRIAKSLEFITIDFDDIKKYIDPISHKLLPEMNLDCLALVLETNHILNREKDSISQCLKQVVNSLGYTNQ